MKFFAARINFRNRTGWEAMDLGFRFAGKYRLLLAVLWLLVALPWFILSIFIFWEQPVWLVAFLWWLKPVFEGSSLSVLSVALFQEPPPFKQALKEAYKQAFNRRLIGDLTWRRFSPNRSLFLPVKQLEQLNGSNYRNRKKILASQASSFATTLTVVGSNIETILYLGLWTIIIWLLTYTVDYNLNAYDLANFEAFLKLLTQETESSANWLLYLSAAFYLLIQSFWGPIYISCGFTLYLNARSCLEAWDIELTFHRLAARLSRVLLLLVCVSLFFGSASAVFAQQLPNKLEAEKLRDNIVNHKPFPHIETKKEYCYKSCEQDKKLKNMVEPEFRGRTSSYSSLFTVLFWGFLVVVLGLFIWYFLRDPTWIASLIKHKKETPKVLFGMEVTPESLPSNVAETAAHYFDTQPRLALSLLYRASLSQLIHQYDLPLGNGNTENEVLFLVQKYVPSVYPYLSLLTGHWINLAYGHKIPPIDMKDTLCQGYQMTFLNIKNNANVIIKAG